MMDNLEEFKYFMDDDLYIIPEKYVSKNEPLKAKEPTPTAPKSEQKLPISGNEKGKVLIITELPLPEHHAALLTKIMAALKVEEGELAFLSSLEAHLLETADFYFENILIFGDTGNQDFLATSKYTSFNINDKKALKSESFEILDKNVGEKKKLWAALQSFFLKH